MLNKILISNDITRQEYLSYPNRPYMRRVVLLGWLKATGKITLEEWLDLSVAHIIIGYGRAK